MKLRIARKIVFGRERNKCNYSFGKRVRACQVINRHMPIPYIWKYMVYTKYVPKKSGLRFVGYATVRSEK